MEPANIYWTGRGKHQREADFVRSKIPDYGKVYRPGYPMLERARKAINAYYDLHHNDLANEKRVFRDIFHIKPTDYRISKYKFEQELFDLVEGKMDSIIIDAYNELLTRGEPTICTTTIKTRKKKYKKRCRPNKC